MMIDATNAKTPETDEHFLGRVIGAADARTAALLDDRHNPDTAHLPHRVLAGRIKLLVACHLATGSRFHASPDALDLAHRFIGHLTAQQGTSGLFVGGDNVNSPPDSAFSLNDLADADALLALVDPVADDVEGLRCQLKEIADAAKAALLAGGVHTPNHRWEICAALARFHRSWPDPVLRTRAEEWLAEGIDIDSDGFYSERSPNYAAYVSNPALLVLGDVFDLPELHALVERNLDLTLDLIRPDGSVETIQSRRQDQNDAYPLAPYLMPYRRFAIERNRSDFAWATTQAAQTELSDPETLLTDILLHPRIAGLVPEPIAPAAERHSLASRVSLASDTSPARTLVTYGGSDYPAFRTIRSGLANNATFARLFAGDAVLDAIRLSRDFFGLGPFRADTFQVLEESAQLPQYRLTETIEASYFHPMPPGRRSTEGTYELTDEGRFAASMAFGERETDTVTLVTTVIVRPTASGAAIEFTFEGPDAPWAIELTFRAGGEFDGVHPLDATDGHLVSGVARYRVGRSAVSFGPGNGKSPGSPPTYRPGQDYSFLGGTDATDGRHAYITGRSPGTYTLHLDAETIDAS